MPKNIESNVQKNLAKTIAQQGLKLVAGLSLFTKVVTDLLFVNYLLTLALNIRY
jgi:hypothetical protein